MIQTLFEFISFGFIQRALLTGCLVGTACAVLGVFLVLRRLSLIGDGLAHITFGSVALALFGGLYGMSMVLVSLPVVVLGSLGVLRLSQTARLGGDAAIGIVSSVGVACGVILSVLGTGYGADLFSYLFGSILAISTGELYVALVLCLVVVLVIWRRYHDLVALTFNEDLAATSGVSIRFLNGLLAVMTAFTVVLAMRLVGIMLKNDHCYGNSLLATGGCGGNCSVVSAQSSFRCDDYFDGVQYFSLCFGLPNVYEFSFA